MSLRKQLTLLHLVSLGFMAGVLLYSYHAMLLTFDQTRMLTISTLGASLFSFIAYWVLTTPIVTSLHQLSESTKRMAALDFQHLDIPQQGPREVQQLAAAFQTMNDHLAQSFQQLETGERLRRELIMNISHDLRTPLAAIQSHVEALQDEVLDDPETMQQYWATIHAETRRLGEMIHDLFELSVLDAGQQTFAPQLTHLDQVLLDVLEGHQILLRDKQLELAVNVAENLPALLIMPQKIGRVLGNLLQNAIRHSPRHSTLELNVSLLDSQSQVEVILRDQGEGVPEHEREMIFNRFYRTDQSRNRASGGAGIGLAIARSLVELHGGRMGVRSRADGEPGSEFWFTLLLPSS